MNLYPFGQPPFVPRDARDQHVARVIDSMAQATSRAQCLHAVFTYAELARFPLEGLRAVLFRTEQLSSSSPLPDPLGLIRLVPDQMRALLAWMDATRRCLEVWLESETCLDLQAAAPPSRQQQTCPVTDHPREEPTYTAARPSWASHLTT